MSIKKNFGYNLMLTMSSYMVAIIVFPYVARVLGVELLGKIEFANNIIGYFSLFSLLGVSTVGIREIASCGDNRERRSKTFSSIFLFILSLTFLSILVFIGCIILIPKFGEYRQMLFIGCFTLVFSSLLIEWLYQGVEQFQYIALRTISVKIAYAISVFLFVKSKEDYLLYYFLTTAMVITNAVINIFYSRKYIEFKLINIDMFKCAKEIVSIGAYKILTSMYTTFNVVFLGFVSSDIQVGYYTTSTKLFYILLGVLSAFTSVMLPRMCSLLSMNKKEEFNSKINISFELVFIFTIPTIIWILFFSPQLILLLSGKGFEGAIFPMRIITPMLLLTGIAQILIIQILMPLKKDKIILLGSVIGAIIGILSNILFVKQYGAIGTALTLLLAELFTDSCSLIYILKNKIFNFPWKKLICYIIAGIPYIILCYIIDSMDLFYILQLIISILICGIYFIVENYLIIRSDFLIRTINRNKDRL